MSYQDVYDYQAFPCIIIRIDLASNFIPTDLTFFSHFTHNHIVPLPSFNVTRYMIFIFV